MTATEARQDRALPCDITLTAAQDRVLAELRHADRPLSAYALRDRLGGQPRLAPMQVYRALDRLMALGLVHRLESLNAYLACTRGDAHGADPVAFAICRSCGQVDELEAQTVRRVLRSAAASRSFEIEAAMLELTGLCRTCRGFDTVNGAPA